MKKFVLFSMLFFVHQGLFAAPQIGYTLSMPEPHTHYFEVKMEVAGLDQESIELKMPVWAPGSYLVREFSKHVEAVKVVGNSKEIDVRSVDKNTWTANTKGLSNVTVYYKVYAFEMSVRTSFLDADHGYLNGTSVFMYIKGHKDKPVVLKVVPFDGWNKVSTSLDKVEGKANTFSAPDYDLLVDSPIEIGNHEVFEFKASGVNHQVAMYGPGNYDMDQLLPDMGKVVDACTDVFGENPNKDYLFLVHNLANGGGGLEHLNSTTLQTSRWSYTPRRRYLGFLSLVAHEYFHLWNVKRIRPKELGPFDYDHEVYTRLLWVMEGFTSFYDEYLLRRAGFYTVDQYLRTVAGGMTYVDNQPGSKVQPVAEASFHAWIKSYRPNENSSNTSISYYTKGSVCAALLNLDIMHHTKGKKCLDDLMQLLYNKYYKELDRGFTEEEFKAAAESIAGHSLDQFFSDYVNGTERIDFQKYLGYAGLEITNTNEGSTEPLLGVRTQLNGGRVTVSRVTRGTAAYKSGLNVDDEMIAINEYRIQSPDHLTTVVNRYEVGDKVEVMVERDGRLRSLTVELEATNRVRYIISLKESPTAAEQAVFEKWLGKDGK